MHYMELLCDNKRHLICIPFSIENLHIMAETLNINKSWFHKDHYDIPKRRIEEIQKKCKIVSTREIIQIVRNETRSYSKNNTSDTIIPDP